MNTPYTWIEINKTAFDHNIANLRAIIGSGHLAVVVKSNAYGHGLLQIGQLCQKNRSVDWLCVANLTEALKLRDHGVIKPVLVFSCIDASPALAIGKNIAFVVPDMMTAHMLQNAGSATAPFPIHLKVDTGLRRLGFEPEDMMQVIAQIKKMPHLQIQGLMTHFAQSQKPDQSFTYQQLEKFNFVLEELEKQNISIPLKHVANTAATLRFDLPQCNFFRVGVSVCGWWANQSLREEIEKKHPSFSLYPVLTWKTRIIGTKKLPAHQAVGYDCTATTHRETKVAFIPVGYFDGYDFLLSNKGSANIKGIPVPILGRVSMNLTTLDITDHPDAKIGDEVVILGPYEKVTAYDWAEHTGNPNVRKSMVTINPNVEKIIVEQPFDNIENFGILAPKSLKRKLDNLA